MRINKAQGKKKKTKNIKKKKISCENISKKTISWKLFNTNLTFTTQLEASHMFSSRALNQSLKLEHKRLQNEPGPAGAFVKYKFNNFANASSFRELLTTSMALNSICSEFAANV